MKSKKLISLLCAAALTASSFAALAVTANAATGDILLAKQTFEETNWGVAARTDRFTVTYEKLADKPSGVEGTKSLAVDSKEGSDGESKVSLPAVASSSTGAYAVEFDTRLVSADYKTGQTQDETTNEWSKDERVLGTGSENFKYAYGFGNESADNNGVVSTYSDMFGIEVRGDSVYLRSGVGNVVDTGFDVPITGAWFHIAFTADSSSAKYKATITPYGDGGTLDTTKAVTKYSLDFPKQTAQAETAKTLTSMLLQSVRYDGATKGLMQKVALDNFVVTEANKIESREITIRYVDASNNIIKTETDTAEEGVAYAVSDSKKANFAAGDGVHYYKYTDTGSTTTIPSVAESGNVITLKFTTDTLKTVTFKAVCGTKELDTIGSATGVPGEKVASEDYAHEYMKDSDNKWYQKVPVTNNRGNTYDLSATVGDSDTTVNVAYKPAYDVVSFKEAEDDDNVTDGTYNTNYPKLNASGGQWVQSETGNNYPKGFYSEAVPADGTYEITVKTHVASKNRGAVVGTLTRANQETKHAVKIGEVVADSGLASGTFTAELAEGGVFWIGRNGDNMTSSYDGKPIDDVDYIVVKDKSLDAAPVPTVTIGDFDSDNDTLSLTLMNSEELLSLGINPAVTVIQAVYNGTALSDVKVWNNIEISSQTGGVTAEITGSSNEDSVFYVWDTVGGVRPLGAAKPYTAERS